MIPHRLDGANLANLGAGPLVVEGYRQGAATMAAKQVLPAGWGDTYS